MSDNDQSDFFAVSGRLMLAQALWRRLTTDRGRLIDGPNYGMNLCNFINDDIGPGDIARIVSMASAEMVKDERVLSVKGEGTYDIETGVLTLTFEVTDGKGPFSLTLSVDDVTVELLTVNQ